MGGMKMSKKENTPKGVDREIEVEDLILSLVSIKETLVFNVKCNEYYPKDYKDKLIQYYEETVDKVILLIRYPERLHPTESACNRDKTST